MTKVLLEVKNLKTHFFTERGIVKAVDNVTFNIMEGETMGIVGESGCGKSVTALSIMNLVPYPGRIVSGDILFEGESLLEKTEDEMRRIRGRRISMIFQDPTSSLDPVFTVGSQISEVFELHAGVQKSTASEEAAKMMDTVGIASAKKRFHDYPHQFSGGMRQRVMIAIALACNPSLLIADEPTTNVDVTIQAQILELTKDLKRRLGSSILLITHDMGIIAEMCDRVAVMYAGEIVEYADTMSLFHDTRHPYTVGLLGCIPRGKRDKDLVPIEGSIPDLIQSPPGCRFHARCPYAKTGCSDKTPELIEVGKGHAVACHQFGGDSFRRTDST